MTSDAGQTPFYTLLESMGEDVWQQDLRSGQVYVSTRFWLSLGYDPGLLPLTSQTARTLIHPVDLELATEEVALHLSSDTPFDLELRIRDASGDTRFLRLRGCVVEKDQDGVALFFAGPITDLTENVHATRGDSEGKAKVATLSKRERRVLECLIAGAPNKNIAYALGLSIRTIEGYHARVLDKLGARGTAELIKIAQSAGINATNPSDCGMSDRAG